jgi:Flp pilus assembly protein CpaB
MPDPNLIIMLLFVTIIVVVSLVAWLISEKIKQTSTKNSLIHDQGFMLALREYKEKTERRITALESEVFEKGSKSDGESAPDSPDSASIKSDSASEQSPSES